MLVEEQYAPPDSLIVEDRETPPAFDSRGEGPQLEGKKKMTGRHILTATLADGRRGTILRLATMLLISFAVALTLASVAQGQETATKDTGVEAFSEESARATPVTVVVDNHNWSDMRIYAVSNGIRYRLGTAYTLRPAEFEVPRTLQADVRGLELIAIPIGGSGIHRSGNVLVSSGDVVEWTLQNRPAFSSYYRFD